MKDVVVVIGAGGIGQAIARRVGAGRHVVLADLRLDVAQARRDAEFDKPRHHHHPSRQRRAEWAARRGLPQDALDKGKGLHDPDKPGVAEWLLANCKIHEKINHLLKGKVMNTRKLANFEVSSVGIGCMGFSHGYGALPPEEDIQRMGYVKPL